MNAVQRAANLCREDFGGEQRRASADVASDSFVKCLLAQPAAIHLASGRIPNECQSILLACTSAIFPEPEHRSRARRLRQGGMREHEHTGR
jgi:hypothetical protein